ncbi:hypothetical protein [Phyllobacterium chamaecytisi]|uniref:hypothetical protein n=1 Tax=Phyllobacterium chamaecytisi TaxID=2876082 RepID=UPI001CCFD025|nr:hypothetical protein [Phyllobacterium sp. KW56]MBZ9604011.1 hypothetical protein [Phyllobacterium sp. KW56]
MALSFEDELKLLGLTLIAAQRVEFLLYGLAAHLSVDAGPKKDKRFRNLTAETFLRGDVSELNATLGQLVKAFGNTLLVHTPELVQFCRDRNLIAHDYNRVFRMNIKGVARDVNGPEFLLDFLDRAQYWQRVLGGLLSEMKLAIATKLGREVEVLSDTEIEEVRAFHENVGKFLASRS